MSSMSFASERVTSRAFAAVLAAFAVALVAAFALSMAPSSAYAYDYTVRVWGGNESTEEGVIHEESVAPGEEYRLEKGWVELKDGSKYYVKGFREGGQDALHTEAFIVNEDMDFVVAYGVQGDQVSYTVSYVEQGTGRALTGSESGQTSVTYYGNKGDKPVVAYEHIPGYRPLYRNITGTLGDEGTNNWVFEYVEIEEPEPIVNTVTTTTTTTVVDNRTTSATATGTGTTGTTGTGTTGTTGTTTTPAAGTGASTAASASSAASTQPQTEELLDVDNPLASGASSSSSASGISSASSASSSSSSSNDQGGFPVAGVVGIIAALIAAILAAFFFLKRGKKAADTLSDATGNTDTTGVDDLKDDE